MERAVEERRIATPLPIRSISAWRRALRLATGTAPAGEPAWAARVAGRRRSARPALSASEVSARLRRIEGLGLGRDCVGVRADLRKEKGKVSLSRLTPLPPLRHLSSPPNP